MHNQQQITKHKEPKCHCHSFAHIRSQSIRFIIFSSLQYHSTTFSFCL